MLSRQTRSCAAFLLFIRGGIVSLTTRNMKFALALKGSPEPPQTRPRPLFSSHAGPGGARTVLVYQDFATTRLV